MRPLLLVLMLHCQHHRKIVAVEVPSARILARTQVLRAAKLQNSSKDLNSNEAVVDNLEELFCSKTVAVCYKAAGLIAPQRDASTFLPKHFSIDHDKFVDLQGGASLGPEIDISFEPKSVRRFTVAFLALANPMDRKKTRAAEVIQAYARRWQGAPSPPPLSVVPHASRPRRLRSRPMCAGAARTTATTP